jgi:hypothetical protein
MLPMLADAAGNFRDEPLTVHALPETIFAIRRNLLNGEIWPDYAALPSPEHPYIRFQPIEQGETELNGRKITALPAHHAVPSVGYQLDSGAASLVYSGDTTYSEDFWQALNRIPNLKYLLIENTFLMPTRRAQHARPHDREPAGRGLQLQRPLSCLSCTWRREHATQQEIQGAIAEYKPALLQRGQKFEF